MNRKSVHFQTLQIHGGLNPEEPTRARGVAIYPTAAYRFESCEQAAALFDLSQQGNIYTRLQNPTTTAYEERVAALYGGVGALGVSSGMSAVMLALVSLCRSGENIITSPRLYGGTHNLMRTTFEKWGIEVRFADDLSSDAFRALADEKTRALYVESMSNPSCMVADLEAIASVAHEIGVPLVVDNTFGAGGYLCNPFDWGADIVVESATKWINGHGTTLGGIIVDSGNFSWNNGKYPQIDGPSEGYHGLNLYEHFGRAAYIAKCRVDGLRDLGCTPSPFDSYLMLIGLETLSLRVKQQVESAYTLARYFDQHPKVRSVQFVGLEGHPSHTLAQKYFRHGAAPILTIELEGDMASTAQFVESLHLAAHMSMIGDSITVVTHPASTTHKQLSDEELASAGISKTMLRLSVGLEHADDLVADFEEAFAQLK